MHGIPGVYCVAFDRVQGGLVPGGRVCDADAVGKE